MYQALYRKWRPKVFSDVVGQEHITETLRRQVAQDRLSHAYLFTGTRGTGKTTCAKILAKAVNCQRPVDGDPCGQCPACQGIDNGSLLDVLELDAASNNGVDHVRALRDEAIYSPAAVRYRVYIVDEVHMLSTAAFNALLKILEEPPAHLIFILATTELHKVPATILSRCQRFAFKRIQPQAIAGRLLYVAEREGIALTRDGAELLSRLADGALRDALSLLDQCAGAGGTVDSQRVLDVLGLAGNVQTARLLDCLLRRDVQASLLLLDELYAAGKDVGTLLSQLTALVRDLLIRMTAPEGGAALLSGGYDQATMDSLSQGVSPTRLIFMAGQLQAVSAALPMSANRRTDAELCLMRLCDESLCGDTTALAARLARLEDSLSSGQRPAPERPAETARRSAPPRRERSAPKPREDERQDRPAAPADMPPWDDPGPIPDGPPLTEAPPPPEDWDAPPLPGDADAPPPPEVEAETRAPAAPAKAAPAAGGVWQALVERYKDRLTPMYRIMLDDAWGDMEGDVLVVRCGDELTEETLDCPAVTEVLRSVTGAHLGREVAVRFTLGKGEAPPAGQAPDKLDALIRAGSKYDSFTVK